VAAPAAFAASRMRFRGRQSFLVAVLSLQMISPLVIMIPLYRYYADLGLLDSYLTTSMVYIAILVPLATWMLKGFFDGIPRQLDEAALVDGCNRFQAFVRVIVPVQTAAVRMRADGLRRVCVSEVSRHEQQERRVPRPV
jgi:multiple sugar transport system permease protein